MTYRVVGIGEILWDRFPDGDRLGGAPANFTFHAGQLGASAQIVSRIGSDADGDRLAALLAKRGLTTDFLQRDVAHPTGLVRVELKEGQPSYVIERCPRRALRLFDINLRQNFFIPETIEFGLSQATVLKLNDEELVRPVGLYGWPTQTEAALREIFQRHPVKLIALTRGAEGCELHTCEGRRVRSLAPKITCLNTVGAGDAFSATLVTGLLANEPLEKIADHANRVGAYVASQSGAMPPLPAEYK